MAEVVLPGCRPEPLASYLKALAILRLVSTQIDASARGWWRDDRFHLSSELDPEGLVHYLVDRYQPTPLVAPWNKGSGFGTDDAKSSPTACAAVETMAGSTDPRLAGYRQAILAVQRLTTSAAWPQDDKPQQVALCRNEVPDESVDWIDATVVLTAESRRFPPLLGTGGNDGRFDFSSNFMQRIAEVLGMTKRGRADATPRELAESALFDHPVRLDKAAIGQFDPGGAGGVASSPLGSADSLSNPWDFVLLLEGAVVFASAAARRLSTGAGAVGVPFMVDAIAAGHATAANESSRGELWAPLWSRPASFPEVARFVGEGRAEFGGRQATSALDFARAVGALGVDRGIDSFVRHAFLERNGLATFAVPVGRVTVAERAGTSLLSVIDAWSGRLKRVKNPPGSLPPLLRRLEEAQFAVAVTGGGETLTDVLVAIAELERVVLRSRALAAIGPAFGLSAEHWLAYIGDDSPEFELAAALASVRRVNTDRWGLLRGLFADLDGLARAATVPGLGIRSIWELLAEAHETLAIRIPPAPLPQRTAHGEPGPIRWLPTAGRHASASAVGSMLAGQGFSDDRFARFLSACLVLDWSTQWKQPDVGNETRRPHPGWAVLAPSFHRGSLPSRYNVATPPVADVGWVRQLRVGRTSEVIGEGLRRLTWAGLRPTIRNANALAIGLDPIRLASALMVPLPGSHIEHLLKAVVASNGRTNSRNMENGA